MHIDDPCDAIADDALRHWIRAPMIIDIQRAVARAFHIPSSFMTGPQRNREYARPRQVAMYLTKRLTPRSYPEIGRRFGGRDHSTVIHGVKAIERLRLIDEEIDEHCVHLIGQFGGSR